MNQEQIEAVRADLHGVATLSGVTDMIRSACKRGLAAIDRLTKERDGAWKSADRSQSELTDAIDDLDEARTRLSAMQEAIDEAVRRADTETPFKTHVIVSDVVEPLRPFATKPKPEVDPLVAVRHYEAALLHAFPAGASGKVFDEWNAARAALSARGGRVVFDGREG